MQKTLAWTLVGLAVPALLSGCALSEESSAEAAPGSLAKAGDLQGVSVAVGGKEFTEQLVLCEITALALESAGAEVERTCGLTGSNTVRTALTSGEIDLYWEYTGTGWVTYLGQTETIQDPQRLYERVRQMDLQQNKIVWLDPAPANNTYAVAAASERARKLGVSTLSDYAALAKKNPQAASFCGAAEFFGRDDGWPGLQKAYGFTLPEEQVSELAAGAIYDSIDKGSPCNFGEVFATDGRIAALDLTVLKDDKKFFVAYNPAVTVRQDVLSQNPAIADVLAPVSKALTDQTLQRLNAQVDVKGKSPEETAQDWLVHKGFISE